MIYLDHAATTPTAAEAREVMVAVLKSEAGNPSSMHAAGRSARATVDRARDQVAAVIGSAYGEVVFTSGGTEANNLAIRGLIERHADKGKHVVTSAIEHEAVLATCERLAEHGVIELTVVGCDGGGKVDTDEVINGVRPDTVLVSVMLVNNEVGTVQDVAAISRGVRERNPNAFVHTDASQALGRLPINVETLGVDLLTLSAHKAYGPKGAGALFVRRGVFVEAQQTGGGQERGRRSGTENVAAIAGFGVAAQRAESQREAEMSRQAKLASRLREKIVDVIPDVLLCGSAIHRVANIVTVAVPNVSSEVVVTALDQHGVCVSGGSACSSGATLPSHVLAAMGVDKRHLQGPLRFSLGEATTESDIDEAVAALADVLTAARGLGSPSHQVTLLPNRS